MTRDRRPLVSLDAVAIGYGGEAILGGISMRVATGDFLAIVGPNGGGKTTLLRALLGVLPLLGGERLQPEPLDEGPEPRVRPERVQLRPHLEVDEVERALGDDAEPIERDAKDPRIGLLAPHLAGVEHDLAVDDGSR